MSLPLQRPDDPTLSAWLDGELDDLHRDQVEAWLRDHPEDAARVRLWAADRDALRARLDPLLDEPVPEALARRVREGGTATRAGGDAAANAPRWRLLAGALALLLIGGVAGALLGPRRRAGEERLAGRAGGAWTQRAAAAHAVYTPEQRHPVEVDVREGDAATRRAQEEHLVKWLSRRVGLPVRLFDLSAQGYALVGGRLLPDAGGQPGAQLMYQDARGERVTLYLRRPDEKTDVAFRYQQQGELGMFYWVEQGYGCAVVGQMPRERLLALAEVAYAAYVADRAGSAPAAPR